MKRSSCNFVASLLIAISCCLANAQDNPGDDAAQDERTQRLKAMRQRIDTLKLTANDEQELKIDDMALFRYSDPTRGIIDATMWAIGSGGRPNAILALEYCDNATAKYELTAVAHPPKRVSATRLDWQPGFSPLVFRALPAAGEPASNQSARERQAKGLVRRLAAEEEYEGTFQLRLMPQPIHRYTDAKIGVIDGTIFVMAHGTNVELLVFVEAQETKDKPQWFVGFSRLGAAALQARFDNETIWAAERNFGGASSSYGNFAEPMNAEELQLFLNSEP